jgi:hypothetical protein
LVHLVAGVVGGACVREGPYRRTKKRFTESYLAQGGRLDPRLKALDSVVRRLSDKKKSRPAEANYRRTIELEPDSAANRFKLADDPARNWRGLGGGSLRRG